MGDIPCLHVMFGYWSGCRDDAQSPSLRGAGPAALPTLLSHRHGWRGREGPGQLAPGQGDEILGWGMHRRSAHMPWAGDGLCPPLPGVLPALPASGGAGDELLPEGEVTPARA